MLLEILLCAALTVLLLGACWAAAAVCLLPVTGKELCVVLSAFGSGSSLEQQCRAYLLLKRFGILRRPLYMTDMGLSEQGRLLAERLTGLDESIRLCEAGELLNLIQNGV